jgi:antitoxin (DNA-binding transcriptional repressor) of toxin-antitoxin stability system
VRDVGEVTVRELCRNGSRVLDRVAGGEQFIITRHGRAVAELRPLTRPELSAVELVARWQRVPVVDAVRLREDVDGMLDGRG